MAITLQRATAGSTSGSQASLTVAVQVDAGTNTGLIVAVVWDNNAGVITSCTYNGVAMTQVGTSYTTGVVALFYLAAPATGTNNVVATPDGGGGGRIQAWVVDGVHQSTAPTYLTGTNGTTVTWSWSSTVGAFLAYAVRRGGTVTWTIGGGGTEDSQAQFYDISGTGNTQCAACGHQLATTTTDAPTYTLSGGDGGTNNYGSIQWLAAAGGGATPLRPWFFG